MPDDDRGQWFTIDDFKPGIHQNVSPNHPPGVAQDIGTFGCYANSSGALIPLPGRTDIITSEELAGSDNIVSEEYRIVGLFVNDPVFNPAEPVTGVFQSNSEIWVAFEWYDDGGTAGADQQVKRVQRYLKNFGITPGWEIIYTRAVDLDFDPATRPKKCEFVSMRSNSANVDEAGPVVVAFVFNEIAQMFPDDTNTTVSATRYLPGDNVDDVIETGGLLSVDGLVSHQGRAVIFPLTILGMGDDQLYVTNEAFYWTLVNNLTTRDDTISGGFFKSIASFDNPTGYQVYQSLTADELLMIKARGGAIVVAGNLNDFQVRNLPNVRGTGHSMNRGTPSPRGFVYPIDNGGVWLWEGGDLSVNIAPQMDPNFWRPPPLVPSLGLVGDIFIPEQFEAEWGYSQTQCCDWNQFVMLPNNWVWDTDHNGWWKIGDGSEFVIHRWAADWAGQVCYGTPSGFALNQDPVIFEFNKISPATTMQWKSHPLAGTIERRVVLREFILTADGDGEVEITVTSADGQTQSETFTIDPALSPHVQATTFGVEGSHVTIHVVSTGVDEDTPAPTIHSLAYEIMDHTKQVRVSD